MFTMSTSPTRTKKSKLCPHIHNMKQKIKQFKSVCCAKCKGKGGNDRLVFCLSCHKLNCSRDSEHAHCINHYIGTKHYLCMSIPTYEESSEYSKSAIIDMLRIWCYKCDIFLDETCIRKDQSPKIKAIKYNVYNCLVKSYKKAVNKKIKPNTKKNKKKNKKNKPDLQNKKQQQKQPHVYKENNHQILKLRFVEYYLFKIDTNYVIPSNIVTICAEFCGNHSFIFGRFSLMQNKKGYRNLFEPNKKYELTKMTLPFSKSKASVRNISIDLQSNKIKIIVANDLVLNKKYICPKDAIYCGCDIYIQCTNLYMKSNAAIMTHDNNKNVFEYDKLAGDMNNAEILEKYESGSVYIYAENDIIMEDDAHILGGHISISCGNNLEMTNGSYIRSYNNFIEITCNQLKVKSKGWNKSYIKSKNKYITTATTRNKYMMNR
eukprot:211484_1